ncbi:MAG: helix-turn-helix domain-containing protein [Planctomycetota bacterium]
MVKDETYQDKSTPEKWYTTKEAAEYLGVSQPTIFRWMKEGVLSFYKIGGATRFSQEGLDSIIEKSTGGKEAERSAGRCVACGHNILIEGRVQATGKLYFKPSKSSFWVLHEAMVPTGAKACPACGYVHFYIETQKLKDLKPKEIKESQKRKSAEEESAE